jgi:hypothetical protein
MTFGAMGGKVPLAKDGEILLPLGYQTSCCVDRMIGGILFRQKIHVSVGVGTIYAWSVVRFVK